MTRSKRFWVAVVIGVVLLCIGGVLIGQRPQRELSAEFRGWGVNPVWPNKSALLLALSNPGPVAVHLSVYAVEQKTPAGWKLQDPAFVFEILQRSEVFVLQIPVATSNATWRIRLHCQERAVGLGGLADQTKEELEKVSRKSIHHRYNGRAYYITNEVRSQ